VKDALTKVLREGEKLLTEAVQVELEEFLEEYEDERTDEVTPGNSTNHDHGDGLEMGQCLFYLGGVVWLLSCLCCFCK